MSISMPSVLTVSNPQHLRQDPGCCLCASSCPNHWRDGDPRIGSNSLNSLKPTLFSSLALRHSNGFLKASALGRGPRKWSSEDRGRAPVCGSVLATKRQFPSRRDSNKVTTTSATRVASAPTDEEEASDNQAGGAAAAERPITEKKLKKSGQLTRWARARKIRAGKLTTIQKKNDSIAEESGEDSDPEQGSPNGTGEGEARLEIYGEDYDDSGRPQEDYGKCVFMISDGTGWTVDHSVHAALGQFEHCMIDRRCSVNTHLFSDVNDGERVMEIVRHAGLEGGMIVYTIADPAIAEVAKQACELLRIPHIDLLGPVTEALGSHLGVSPSGLSRGAPGRKSALSLQYFKRIEAVEFTIKQDDGALPKNLKLADIVLVGVSRTSKTPLSTYIAQKGYKVANVPLVYGISPPKELFEIDQDKVFGLTINANFLKAIRLARYRQLGVAENSRSSYSDMEHIRRELESSRKLFSQNPRWPVVEVTGKAIEETAAVILRLYHERRNKHSMPRISTRY